MSYIKKVWVDDETPISALNMNHIEQFLETHEETKSAETINGHSRLATQSEVHSGTVEASVVTPSTLDGMWITEAAAAETQRGYLGETMFIIEDDIWLKCKQFTVPHDGIYRTKFNMKTQGSTYDAYGRIYKNGVAYGTERWERDAVVTTYTEDLYFNAGDRCEIWCMSNYPLGNGMYLYWASLHFDPTIKHYRVENPKVADTTGAEIYGY